MRQKPLSKMMAVILIMVLTLVDFLTIGLSLVSYAANEWSLETATNHENVTFDVYGKGENGEVLETKEESINGSDMKLFLLVTVKQEGNFNGKIELKDSNFRWKQEVVSNAIREIDGNTITLNQIHAGERVEIEIGIEPIQENKISPNFLQSQSNLILSGTYQDSEQREKSIQAQRKVTFIWNSPYEEGEGQELTSEILTNHVYEINGENKRMVQLLLKSGLRGNAYPIKATHLEVSTLEGVEAISVITRGTKATNGKNEIDFNKSNWQYVQETDKLQIQVTNEEEEGKISWEKQGQDEFVVTYLLDENTPITQPITTTATIILPDVNQTQKTTTTTVAVQEEKDGIVTTSTNLAETSIHKGKIYAKQERNYQVTTNLYIANNSVNQTIDICLEESTYQMADTSVKANVQYVKTTVKKSQVERILGENGSMNLLTVDGDLIFQIHRETPTDENGNVTIYYPEGIKQVQIHTTEIIGTGTIALENTKGMKPEDYNQETMRQWQAIHEGATGSSANMILEDTTTAAKIEINQDYLSTLSKNENVEFKVTLCTDDEKYDLFKNPNIKVRLPSGIQNLEVKSIHLVHGNAFRQENAQVIEENGQKVIEIALSGEQTHYTADINQATLVIVADITFGILTPSQVQKIQLDFTNEKGKEIAYQESIDQKIESKYGLMIYSEMSRFNEAGDYNFTLDNEVPTGVLDLASNERIATMGIAILNNYEEDMTNVSIIGRIPTKGIYDGTIDTQLVNSIETNLDKVTVMYSTSSTASLTDDSWTERAEHAKSYKIVFDKVAKGQLIQMRYGFVIPKELTYGQSLYGKTEVNYTYLDNPMNQTSHIGAETQRMTMDKTSVLNKAVTTKMENGVDVSISTTTAGSELQVGDEVYEGQTIKYVMKLTNHTGHDLSNIKVQAIQENANIFDLKGYDAYNDGTGEDNLTSYFWEELDTNQKEFVLESLKNEESVDLSYQAIVKEVENQDAKVVGNITVETEETQTQTVTTIANPIKQAKLKMVIKQAAAEELKLYSLNPTSYVIQVKNLSQETLKDVAIEVEPSDGLVFSEPYDVKAYLPNQDGVEANVLNGVTTSNDVFTIHVSKIDPGEDGLLNIAIRPYLDGFEGDTQEVNIYTKCTLHESETYFSNVSNRTIYQTQRNITITQTANISEDTILKDGQEFQISVEIQNKGTDVKASIYDFFLDGLVATSGYWHTEDGQNHTITVDEDGIFEDDEETNDEEYVIITNNKLVANKPLKKNEKLIMVLNVVADATKVEENPITNKITVSYDFLTVESNELKFRVEEKKDDSNRSPVTVKQVGNPENNTTIKDGNQVTYTATINNLVDEEHDITITDKLPEGIVVQSVFLEGKEITEQCLQNNTIIIANYSIKELATVTLQIHAVLVESQVTSETLSNIISVTTAMTETKSNEIVYYVTSQNTNDSNHGSSNQNPNRPKGQTYTISGVAWLDEDKSGSRETKENLIEGIKIKVIDVSTGSYVQKDGSDLSTTTSSDGSYSLTLEEGDYVVVFEYDTEKYGITEYQKSGIAETVNSDAISKMVDDNTVGVTDTISIRHDNVEHIDIGLIEASIFDLELNKYIDKITVQNKEGTKVYQYDNTKMAKVEIAGKQLAGSIVTLEYTIKVTNTGDTEGYVKSMVDHMPNSLRFDGSINKNWYQSDSNLYYTSLENSKIEPGETKEVTLILSKTMSENNTGPVSNTAEIVDEYHSFGSSNADVIISVKTGRLILYLSLAVVINAMIGFGVYWIRKNVVKREIKF